MKKRIVVLFVFLMLPQVLQATSSLSLYSVNHLYAVECQFSAILDKQGEEIIIYNYAKLSDHFSVSDGGIYSPWMEKGKYDQLPERFKENRNFLMAGQSSQSLFEDQANNSFGFSAWALPVEDLPDTFDLYLKIKARSFYFGKSDEVVEQSDRSGRVVVEPKGEAQFNFDWLAGFEKSTLKGRLMYAQSIVQNEDFIYKKFLYFEDSDEYASQVGIDYSCRIVRNHRKK